MSLPVLRVSHVNYSPGMGVDRKLEAQAAAARREGLALDFYTMGRSEPDSDRDNLHVRRARGSQPRGRLARYLEANRSRLADLSSLVGPGRRVILRFPKVPASYVLAFLRLGRYIVTEHHTDEVSEIIVRKGLKRRLLALAVAIASRFLLRRAAGHIAVTDEIRQIETRKSGLDAAVTVTNGVDAHGTPFTGFRPFDGERLTLLAVSADFQAWHAVDRLLDGAARYRGPIAITIMLVGRVDPRVSEAAGAGQCSVAIGGRLDGSELDRRFREAGVAVGSLGLHRNRMRQACPLKVREYVARGIPFIYAYDDPDIPANAPWALKLPADDTPIDIDLVIEFARRVSALPALSAQMRRFAEERLDWGIRVRQMYEFALRLQGGDRG